MSNQTTATVETLTAEVRVLMVGNRQITQSVARQLDRVELDELKMFGRVRLGEDTLIIGSHFESGVLCISDPKPFRKPPGWRAILQYDGDRESGPSTQNPYHWGLGDRLVSVSLAGVPCEIFASDLAEDRSAYNRHRAAVDAWNEAKQNYWTTHHKDYPHPFPAEPTYTWNPGSAKADLESQASKQFGQAVYRNDLYELAISLPLIVLAGLR